MATVVHPKAVVDPRAEIADGVEIGPYAVVEAGVVLGPGCRVDPHAHLRGPLEIGPECVIGTGAAIGHDPQVRGKAGPFGRVRIGARNVFREHTQVHRSMSPDGETQIGDDGYFMVASHVAHDCRIGNQVTLCNGTLLAGHVEVGDRAFLSALVAVHQFCRIGELAMIGGIAAVNLDAPPFGMLAGSRPVRLRGLNVVGLRRAGVASETRAELERAYRTLFRSSLPVPERLAAIQPRTPEAERLLRFVRESRRGVHGLARSDVDPADSA